jgi:N-acetylmuramoyl-L-alanine amidase CwlA
MLHTQVGGTVCQKTWLADSKMRPNIRHNPNRVLSVVIPSKVHHPDEAASAIGDDNVILLLDPPLPAICGHLDEP